MADETIRLLRRVLGFSSFLLFGSFLVSSRKSLRRTIFTLAPPRRLCPLPLYSPSTITSHYLVVGITSPHTLPQTPRRNL